MKIRSFIAINLPNEIKKEIGLLIEKLKKKNKNKPIKWVSDEGLHITLHFLGSQEEIVLEKVDKIIERKIKELHLGQNILKLSLTVIDAFPNLLRPRVIFIGCQEEGNRNLVKKLQKEIGKELEKLGIEIEKRDWIPHITLARVKIPTKIDILNEQLSNLSFEVKSIDLMKSELTPQGAKYSILKSLKL
ncbi:MAG: RNA 2',3'-cyclic phosphodiesterase [Patescibacteria group bacterium]